MTQRFSTLPAPALSAGALCVHALRAPIVAFGRSTWYHQVLLAALGAVVLLLTAGWLGATLLTTYVGWGDGVVVNKGVAVTWPGLFVRFDSWYYLQIAREGYRPDGSERAFFPLYPLLARWLAQLTGLSLLWSGFLLSLGSFVGSALLLYRWVHHDHGAKVALQATLIFCFFPMTFFHMAFYAEPLLLLTTAAFFYFAQRGHFVAAGLAICLAGATRGTAFLLAVPYLVELLIEITLKHGTNSTDFYPRAFVPCLNGLSISQYRSRRWLEWTVGGLLAPLGFLTYYHYRGFHVEGGWGTHYDWPWTVFWHGLNAALFGTNIDPDWFSRLLVWQDLLYAVGALLVGLWAFGKLRWSATLFLVLSVIFMWTLHGPEGYAFWSTPRRIALLLPLYPALALLLGRMPLRMQQLLLVLSALLLALMAAWFASGRWVA